MLISREDFVAMSNVAMNSGNVVRLIVSFLLLEEEQTQKLLECKQEVS